jgi:hypothetical protein
MIEEAELGGGGGGMRGLRVVCVGGSGQCLTHPVSPEVRDRMRYVARALERGGATVEYVETLPFTG